MYKIKLNYVVFFPSVGCNIVKVKDRILSDLPLSVKDKSETKLATDILLTSLYEMTLLIISRNVLFKQEIQIKQSHKKKRKNTVSSIKE